MPKILDNQTDTEPKALQTIAEMLMQFERLHIMNIRQEDRKQLHMVRECLEKIIHDNGFRMNYDRNLKNNIIKL
jgi:hypothetical protein